MAIRTAIVNHMLHLADDDHNFTEHPSVEQYIVDTGMCEDGTWATTNEMVAVAHLLRTCLFSYDMGDASWHRFTPQNVEVNDDDCDEWKSWLSLNFNYNYQQDSKAIHG